MDKTTLNNTYLNFKSSESLKPIEKLIKEIDAALNDKSRTNSENPIFEEINKVLNNIYSEYIYNFGISPLPSKTKLIRTAIAKRTNTNLNNTKRIYYKNAIEKQNALTKAIMNEIDSSKNRIEYLKKLNEFLGVFIVYLKDDLNIK